MRRHSRSSSGSSTTSFAEVGLKQRAIFRFENIERQRIAAFLDRVDDLLELGEHRLPEERAADVVDLAVDDVGAHLWIVGLLEQMMSEQLFVEGGGDLGEKDRIIVILKGLRSFARTRCASNVRLRARACRRRKRRRSCNSSGCRAARRNCRMKKRRCVCLSSRSDRTSARANLRQRADVFRAERRERGEHVSRSPRRR